MCPTLEEKRISKRKAAKTVRINRKTVYRYAQKNLISENEKGKVLLSEVKRVWNTPVKRSRSSTARAKFIPGWFFLNKHQDLLARSFIEELEVELMEFIAMRSKMEKATNLALASRLVSSVLAKKDKLKRVLTGELQVSDQEANQILREGKNTDWIWNYLEVVEAKYLRLSKTELD